MNKSILGNISRYAFILLALILPIWLLPYTVFPLELNKAFLFYAITIVAGLLWLVSILQKASFQIPKSAALLVLSAIVVIWLVSSFFSGNAMLSLIGSGHEVGTFFSLILLGLALFLASVLFQTEAKAMVFYLSLFTSSLIVFVFQLFRSGFDITLFPWAIFASKISNPIGSWNEVGVFFGFIALLALVFIELFHFDRWLKVFLFATFIASLAAVAFVNFTAVWVVLGIFCLVLLVYLFSVFLSRKFIRYTVFVLLIALFFIMGRALIGDFVSGLGLTSIEVRPAWSSTWQIIKSALKENALLGTGPNTFLYDWLKFKPADINLTLFWAFPFAAGIGLLPSWLATAGILAGLGWLVFFAFLLYYGLKIITYSENEVLRGLLIASFFGSLYLWTFTMIYPTGFLLVSLAFLTTGVFIGLLCRSGKIKVIEASFLDKPKLGFVSSLAIVLLMIAAVATFYLLFQKYLAAYSFGAGLIVFNTTGNIDEAENSISRATRFDQQDRYYRALSEIGLVRLQQLAVQTNLPQDQAQSRFQNILGFSIGNAQTAARLNPLDFQNWMSLGQVYESLVPFGVAGAAEAAISAYQESAKRAPFDPRPLFVSARTEIQANDMTSARTFLNSALNIKGDYAPAVFLLAQIEAQEGNLKEAITRTEQTLYLAPNDVGVLFQLGLLYYQDKNYENSRLAFERAVNINPNYSNARYFLGLIYGKQGKTSGAIEQFKRIRDLNPDNQEVQRILSNLTSGRSALESISPPAPVPEKREEPPVDETKSEKELQKKK